MTTAAHESPARPRRRCSLFLAMAALGVAGAAILAPTARAADPPVAAAAPPASMEEVTLKSGGARLNGLLYLAAGPAPHPVVVFLHGYPGNERNLDLAQAVRRAGFDALYFDYRGNWGSGGTFSFAHALDDAAAAVAWVRDPVVAARYGFDGRHVAVFGHSFGGWLALMNAGASHGLPPDVCVAVAAAWNVGWAAQHEAQRKDTLAEFGGDTDPAGGPIRARAADLGAEFIAHAKEWDYLAQATTLKERTLLLVSATHDSADEDVAMHRALESAVRAAGGTRVRSLVYDDDHPFSSHRLELAQELVQWLRTDCRASQGR